MPWSEGSYLKWKTTPLAPKVDLNCLGKSAKPPGCKLC